MKLPFGKIMVYSLTDWDDGALQDAVASTELQRVFNANKGEIQEAGCV
jgi:hypothetical protein